MISAPTGSGKTFSAFMVLIDHLLKKSYANKLKQETKVLYLSPLKALSNDIEKNLSEPLRALERLAKQDDPGIKPIQIALRTGDSSSHHKNSLLKKPPHILVTTPESLYLLLGSLRGRTLLSTLETVIVDEIHILAADKRGSHLALSLERLQLLCQKPLQRIGLSATQKPLEKIAQFLVGFEAKSKSTLINFDEKNIEAEITKTATRNSVSRPCHIINLANKRVFDLGIIVPQNIPLSAVCSHEAWDDILSQLAQLIKQHRSTLIFVNTRRLAERIAYLLREHFPADKIACHHGSLSKELRLQAESSLKSGELAALVATASLELGIDIGSIDLVCQISSPRNIATFIQRVGRSGHMYKGTPKGRIFALTQEELVEATALLIATQQGILDKIEVPNKPIDILAQHLIAELAINSETRLKLFEWVRCAAPYHSLSSQEFDKVLAMLIQGYAPEQRERALIHYDALEDRFISKGPARLVALMNGGAIPDHGDFPVILEQDNIKLGSVSEDFAIESSRGDIFSLGSHSWKITKISQGKVYVQDVGTALPNIPAWFGEAPGRSLELSLEYAQLRSNIAEKLDLKEVKKDLKNLNESFLELVEQIPNCYRAASQWLNQHIHLEPSTAIQLIHYIARQNAHLGIIPSEKSIVFERFFDASNGMQLVVHSPYGMRINRALGLAMRKRFCRSFDFELQAAADDNGFVLSLGPQHSFPIDALFGMLQPENLRHLLEQAILPLPMFATRWRWNCSRALAVARMKQGTRVPPALQRFRSEDLLSKVFPQQTGCQENLVGELTIPDHPLVLQSIDDCLSEAMDLIGACQVLENKRNGQVHFIALESAEASPFAQALINTRPYTFLDGAPLEDRRTRVTPYRHQTIKLPENQTQIEASLLAEFANRIKPAPQNRDDLLNLLTDLVMVRNNELNLNPLWLQKLITDKKIAAVPLDSGTFLYPTEYLSRLRSLCPTVDFLSENIFAKDVFVQNNKINHLDEEQLLNLWVKSRLRYFGIKKEADLFSALPFVDSQLILSALYRLEGRGEVMRGLYSLEAMTTEWIYRPHLMQLQKQSREFGKPQFKAIELAEYWQLLVEQQRSPQRIFNEENLLSVVEQLAGWQAPLKIWEDEILASRLQKYDAHILDQLCLQGLLSWSRLIAHSEKNTLTKVQPLRLNTPISIYPRAYQTWILGTSAQKIAQLPSTVEVVYEHLLKKGACFASDLPAALRLFPEDINQALLKLAALGLAHSDSLAAIRGYRTRRTQRRNSTIILNNLTQESIRQIHLGRWSLIPEQQVNDLHLELWLDLLLERWGILFYEITLIEAHAPSWQDLRALLKRREAQGLLYSGYFIKGLSGEQYAKPNFLEKAQNSKTRIRNQETLVLHYIHRQDPLNIISLHPLEQRPDIKRGERFLLRNGKVVAYAEKGKTELFCDFGGETAKIEKNLRLQQLWRLNASDVWSS